MIAVESVDIITRHNLLTTPRCAQALRQGVEQGWRIGDLLRLVREMLSNAQLLTTPEQREQFFAEPEDTGDPRWDAMLAGCVEMIHLRNQWPAPAWTPGHALDYFWWVNPGPAMQAYVFARSPMSLHLRGVLIDPADLESV